MVEPVTVDTSGQNLAMILWRFAGDRMKRFVEGADRSQGALFRHALMTGLARIIPFASSTFSSMSSISGRSGSAGSIPRQLAGLPIIRPVC